MVQVVMAVTVLVAVAVLVKQVIQTEHQRVVMDYLTLIKMAQAIHTLVVAVVVVTEVQMVELVAVAVDEVVLTE